MKYPGIYCPVGVDLTSVSVPASSLPDVASDWIDFDFPDIWLNSDTAYAIICGAPDANETDFPRWHRVQDTGTYLCGCVASSSDYGENWGLVFDDDFLFREFGYIW